MEAELLELAREAVAALQLQAEAAGRTRWVEVAQLLISGLGLLAILVGLERMKESGVRRDREIDELAAAFRQQGQALERQGRALEEVLRRTASPTGQNEAS